MIEPYLTAIKLIFFFVDTIHKLLPSIKPLNPKILENKYYTKHKKKMKRWRDEVKEVKEIDQSEYNTFLIIIKPKLEMKAKRYVFRSDLAWGRNIVQRYKSAWFNVLAGEFFELAEDFQAAGAQFHFAGHTFRGLGNYRQAAKFYCKSTTCFKEARNFDMAIRACRRAIAVYRYETGQEELADKLKTHLDEWQKA